MSRKMKDILELRAAQSFVGRSEELAALLRAVQQDMPVVTHIHGLPGIGKSSLLSAFAEHGRASGAAFVCLDCRSIEPSPQGFLRELGAASGGNPYTPEQAASRLQTLGDRVALTLDTYEVFRMLDTWLRQIFVPALDDNVRVFFFGREAPVPAWLISPGWQESFQTVRLEPLGEPEAKELLESAGVQEDDTDRVNRFARGYPLALKLAAAAIAERPDLKLEEVASQHVIPEVTRMFLADVTDALTRETLSAGSVIRRTNQALLQVMLPHAAPQDAYERLQALPFVETASDGLIIHDAVQQATAASLLAADPGKYRFYRRAAWKYLRNELRSARQLAQ